MRRYYVIIAIILISLPSWAQDSKMWSDRAESVLFLENTPRSNVFPENRRVFNLDFNRFDEALRQNAPDEFSGESGFVINLPLPDGGSERFKMFYSPVYEKGYEETHPDIRTYKGYSLNKNKWVTRMSVTPLGLKTSIMTNNGEIYIDPIIDGETSVHAVYNTSDYPSEILDDEGLGCGLNKMTSSPLEQFDLSKLKGGNELRGAGEPIALRTFRVAIASTGEWTSFNGGLSATSAKIVASIDRLNLIYENEAGVRLLLIANNDQIVFLDGSTDPYLEPRLGRSLIGVNTNVLRNNIGADSYDVGHVFTVRCNDVGGVAQLGSVCQGNKGAGCTCWANSSIEYVVVRVFAHEMGHQFSANHTFNLCDNDNESLRTGYEPGSGSTIMSYGGLCGINNVVSGAAASRDITYFHANSIMSIYTMSRAINCGNTINTGNTKPDALMDYENGFTIPIRTPFHLEGTGVDSENDVLSYCFEEHDWNSKTCTLGQPEGSCPAFRSFPPNADDYRVFPQFNLIWNNQTFSNKNEVLVDYSREYNFILSVRDNNAESGGWGMDTVTFNTDENSGPFTLLYPNAGEEQIAGDIIEVVWDVANTNKAPVNCNEVDILLYNSSIWGDFTMLKSRTANSGSAWVQIPNQAQNSARILVRASDNIFFDVTNRNFNIVDPTSPGYAWGITPNYGRVCVPDVFTTEVSSAVFGGFQGSIELSITDGLPTGATYDFDQSTLEASKSTMLTIDLSAAMVQGTEIFDIAVTGISSSGETLTRSITLELIGNDFSAMTLTTPSDGEQGVAQSTSFQWEGVIDAELYNFQLATSPSFAANTIVQEDFNISGTSVSLNDILEKKTLYYWRVQGINVCGESTYTIPNAFSTEAASCKTVTSQDQDVTVPTNTTSEYNITVDVDATINDLNISKFVMFCDQLQDATISLRSPAGTEVLIAEKECGNTTDYDCRFDSESNKRIACPPNDGRAYKPRKSFTQFNGESAIGKWILVLDITRFAGSVELNTWELEVCVNITLDAPFIVTNDVMKMKPSEQSPLRNSFLLTSDNNNSASELEYSLLSLPIYGEMILNGQKLGLGGTFTQDDINSKKIEYKQTSGQNNMDQFVFTVNDGEGGWTGSHTFVIDANEDYPSSTSNLDFKQLFTIFPNPTSGQTQLIFTEEMLSDVTIEIYNLQGQTIQTLDVAKGTTSLDLDFAHLSDGVYLVKTQTTEVYYIEKVTVQGR